MGLVILAFPPLFLAQNKTVIDDAGNVFSATASPRRIVSLAPNITEILFALGFGDRVVGVTRYCDYPPAALLKEKIGGLTDPDVEKIKSLGPDLVIAFRGNPWSAIKRLQALRLRVFVLDIGGSLESVPKTIEKVGRITHNENGARALIESLNDRLRKTTAALARTTAKPKVFLSLQGMGLVTCGRESYLNDMLDKAKSVNIAGRIRRAWLTYDRERFIQDDPDVIIIMAKSEGDFRKAREWFMAQAGFQTVAAVRTGRIHYLDENIASRPGPRLYDAFAELARLLHPGIN